MIQQNSVSQMVEVVSTPNVIETVQIFGAKWEHKINKSER